LLDARTACSVAHKLLAQVIDHRCLYGSQCQKETDAMTAKHLATYVNDHLAGSVVALELMEHLEAAHSDTAIASFLASLRSEVEADRQQLEALAAELAGGESRTRQALAWLGEKAAELKLQLDDSATGAMRLFEGLEVLSLGIEGKRGLWLVLASMARVIPQLRGLDYERLIQRAEAQRDQVEAERLNAARAVFGATS
jgi:hypothetical protein